MVVAIGVVHPKGEDADYDGLFFKQGEMQQLSKDLVGLPLCIEHLDEHVVGEIIHSWVSTEEHRPECFVMFQTDDNDIRGNIASNLIQKGFCTDLSLGHECEIESSSLSVIKKTPKEVSICSQGARPRTHIYGFQKKNKSQKKYIKIQALASKSQINNIHQLKKNNLKFIIKSSFLNSALAPLPSNMSVDMNAAAAPATASTSEAAPAAAPLQVGATAPETPAQSEIQSTDAPLDTNVIGELMTQLQALKEQNKQLAYQNEEHARAGKRKREAAVDGNIKEMIASLFKEYESLGLHKEELEKQLEAMKSSPQADGIVEMLSCAAAKQSSSVVALEKELQEKKRLLEENKKLKTQITRFADPSERVVETVSAVASKRALAAAAAPVVKNSFDAMFSTSAKAASSSGVGAAKGMRELYPNLYDSLISGSENVSGMQKFGTQDAKFFNTKMTKANVVGSGFQTHTFE